jgi:glycosyltransferase involved in cell wall biosynthesis
MNKLRVVFCAPKLGVSGGISKWAKFILDELKFDEQVELQHLEFTRSSFIAYENLINRILLGIKDYSLFILKIIKQLLKFNNDVVYVSSSGSLGLIRDFLILTLCKLFNVKFIIHFHFGRIPLIFENNNWEKKILLLVIRFSTKTIVLDKSSYNILSELFKNIEYLPNPLSTEVKEYANSSSLVERKPRTILFVGEMLKSKGVFDLLEACKDITDIKLIMVGFVNKETSNKILQYNRIKSCNWIELKGFLNHKDVINEMLVCDLFVFPSHTEGFPNVIIEAMYCQCTIIASSVGEIPEMLDIESLNPSGDCTKAKDIKDIKFKILYFLEHPLISKNYGKNAKARVIKEYDITKVISKLKFILIEKQNE